MVVLGPVVFAGFEVPERIALGGRQRLVEHALPGGVRVLDAMGADDAEIAWSGVVSGPDAGARVRLLDGLRRGGQPWGLAWDGWRFTVVVKRFAAEVSGPFWMPYRISCAVVCEGEPVAAENELAGLGAQVVDQEAMATASEGLGSGSLAAVVNAAGRLARGYWNIS